MCLIIDTNVAHHFVSPVHQDAAKILDWLTKRKGRIMYGGKNADELFDAGPDVKRLLITLDRAGLAKRFSHVVLQAETEAVVGLGLCCSDDPHVLALARVSHARILYSHDADLHTDFKNTAIVPKPKGTIYQDASHVHLLKHNTSCQY